MRKRKDIGVLLQSNQLDAETKQKLTKVTQARIFAIKHLKLSPEGGFVYYVSLDREELGWHVTASYPLEFKPYTWWFPIVGDVPYKGYFSLKKTKIEQEKLDRQGLDTRLRITAGYSTLGWFSDPIFSTQIKRDEDQIFALVFHEMAHGTIYFNGDALFNESYANFVEEKGTELYYQKLNTENAKTILQERAERKEKNRLVIEEIKHTAKLLDAMYKSEITDAQKHKKKQELLQLFKDTVSERLSRFKSFSRERLQKKQLNNEDFIGALRYNSGEAFFVKKFQECRQDFTCFHQKMRKLQELSQEERKKLLLPYQQEQ